MFFGARFAWPYRGRHPRQGEGVPRKPRPVALESPTQVLVPEPGLASTNYLRQLESRSLPLPN